MWSLLSKCGYFFSLKNIVNTGVEIRIFYIVGKTAGVDK